ncbi:MAG TPA: OB-fold domain-containing protein [Acidimicrobiales bacterium]|nr:OB-fold domain-containing protein [Acidimicrobiales bacterium]
MAGLVSYGTYIPRHRLKRSEISSVLSSGKGPAGGTARGTRAVAGYDEDSTSMGVEAARQALRRAPGVSPARLIFATSSPPYLDKTNANTIHAALRLDPAALALDMAGSVRSGVGAMLLAHESPQPTLVVLSDLRTGLPGGSDERDGGDAAAAFLFGAGDPLVEVVAEASSTDEFLDRWRLPGSPASRVWEERFGEHVYVPLADAAFADALKKAGMAPSDVDLLIVAGTHARAARVFSSAAGVDRVADDLGGSVGNPGAAQPGILLAAALDQAHPGQRIALVVLADGATAQILRVTEAAAAPKAGQSVAEQVAAGDESLRYATFLSWRGFLTREPPRRPDPVAPAAPPTHRSAGYKYGFVGHRCRDCGTVHLPAVRVCVNCKSVDRMVDVPMADQAGTIATFTIDHLAYSPSPPVIAAVVDLDAGGRFSCELTDADPQAVAIGDRVEMTFRRTVTAGGVHNYFWKARPAARSAGA